MDLSEKIILVTGGASGIGRAAAVLCAARGARVVIADLNEKEGQYAAQQFNAAQKGGACFFPVDVADEASVRGLFARVEAEYGRLDVLLHCAGVLQGAFVPIDEFPVETFRRVVEINTIGSFLCAKYAVPLLRKFSGGVIVLVSSGAATGGSSSFAYGSSKGGVHSLGIVLANSLAGDGIRVNVLAPGNIDTAMKRSVIAADVQRKGQPDRFEQAVAESQLGQPEGVARILAWLASDEADYVRGVITTR
jgi:NAD(P)-dependent dehydrogenase (short-subunit alcohol dehydrogenase family)